MAHSNCNACAFYEDHAANSDSKLQNAGLCRANPPISQPAAETRGFWPVVSANDWCGKFSGAVAAE
ncbi:hypothetical protein BVG79_00214 [Ketogulonicigenium robustum]|uniref:Uncharacterized protein n=1 Tax=Ketogulonicigenium robustum TaxID=92947 RepID=A0A1W6NWJ5_9RHOB|nr:hypothetical protein [Ketogulonicigenium robustum]ARO13574.1 hypothetical protein BVG79_00214 [Ketogulonicigenium robustum]